MQGYRYAYLSDFSTAKVRRERANTLRLIDYWGRMGETTKAAALRELVAAMDALLAERARA